MKSPDELIRRLANLLDAAIPALESAARNEKRREAGKPMRQITEQQRLAFSKEAVAEAEEYFAEKRLAEPSA